MKVVLVLAMAAFLGSLTAGCSTSQKSGVAAEQVHECPACKEKVTWLYGHWPGGPKGIPTGKKVVTHECSMCKQAWSSAVADASTCAACSQQVAVCPACLSARK